MAITLPDQDTEIAPVPGVGGGRKPEPELDFLSNTLRMFNELFGNIPWSDKDRLLVDNSCNRELVIEIMVAIQLENWLA